MKRVQLSFLAVALMAWTPLALIVAMGLGCQAGTSGVVRPLSDGAYTSATNTIAEVSQVGGAVIPAPWAEAFRVICAAAIAGLGAWQAWTHGRLKRIATQVAVTKNKAPV